jgi:hypothetical protein
VRHRWHVRLRPGDEVRCRTYCQGKLMLPAQQFVLHHTCLRTHRLAIGISMHWEYRSSVLRGGGYSVLVEIRCERQQCRASLGLAWLSGAFWGLARSECTIEKWKWTKKVIRSDSVLLVAARKITTVTASSTMAPRSCTPVPASCEFLSAMRSRLFTSWQTQFHTRILASGRVCEPVK